MGRKRKRKFKQKPKRKKHLALPQEIKQMIFGVILMSAAIIIGLSFFNKAGRAGFYFMKGSRFLIGNVIFLVPLILVLAGLAFFAKKERKEEEQEKKIDELINKISDALSLILREIKLEDQFKTRMDLVVEDQIRSEDVAKLTSLRGKSHYDVLRERFFFQYIVKWFHEIYLREIQKFKDF